MTSAKCERHSSTDHCRLDRLRYYSSGSGSTVSTVPTSSLPCPQSVSTHLNFVYSTHITYFYIFLPFYFLFLFLSFPLSFTLSFSNSLSLSFYQCHQCNSRTSNLPIYRMNPYTDHNKGLESYAHTEKVSQNQPTVQHMHLV
jgi:hypothetical protein